jgi:hypothetical protein
LPNWKKVIVSGSDASLNSITTPAGTINNITASNAITASYALTASYTPSIAGTDNYIPRFNGSSALENSVMYDDGTNIGIGTTSPAAKLHVSGSVSASIFYPFNAGGNYIQGDGSGLVAGGPSYFYSAGSGGSYFEGQVRIRGALANDTAAYMQINGGTSNYTYINGSLGIGTTTPSTTLSLAGATATTFGLSLTPNGWNGAKHRFTVPTSGDTSMWSFNWNGSTTDASYATSAITLGQGLITFATTGSPNTPSERMRIDGNGNIGIGTTSPPGNSTNRALEIAGADSANLVVTQPGYATAALTSYNNEAYVGTSTNHPFYLYTNGSERVRITATGNVGIGTTTPTSNLQVQSNNLSAPAFAVSKSFSGGGDGTAVMHAFGFDSGIANTGIQVGVKGTGGFSATDAYPFRVFNLGTASFDVKANNGIKFNYYGSGTFTGTATQKLAVDSSGNVIEIPIGAGPVDGSGTANYITRWVDTDTITTSSIYESSGNIGIGATSPGALLQIGTSTVTTDSILRLSVAYAGDRAPRGGITWHDTSNTTGKIYTEYDGTMTSMVFGSLYNSGYNSNQLMIIRGNGNVGIGTDTPAYKLSVVGKIALNDGGNSLFIGNNAGLSDDATNNSNIGIGTNSLQNNISGSQNVAIGHNTLVNNTNVNNTAVGTNALQFSTTALNNVAFGSFALNANLVGSSNAALGTAALISNTSGSANTAVGNSALRLNVSGSNNVGLGGSVMFNNVNGNDNVALGYFAARYFGTGTSALTDTSGSIFIGSLARANASGEVNQIVIGMNALGLGSNTVVLGNDNVTTTALKGNVGIGTTSPNGKLEVNGSAYFGTFINTDIKYSFVSSGSVGSYHTYVNNTNSTGGTYGLGVNIANTSTNGYILGLSSGGTERMIVRNDGNVGIGTTSPSNLLNTFIADGSGGFSKGIRIQTGNGSFTSGHGGMLEFQNEDVLTAGIRGVRESGWGSGLVFYVHNTSSGNTFDSTFVERMRINESGNVGIGTSNPIYLIDAYSTSTNTNRISITGTTNFALFQANNSSGTLYLGIDNSIGNGFSQGVYTRVLYSSDNYPLAISTNGAERMRILANGNVGIGTSSPSQLLDVNGRARVDRFQYIQGIYIGNLNLNDYTDAGFYNGDNMSNAPNSGWFFVTVERHSDANWVHQTATSYGAGNTANEVYTRVKSSGTWGAWKQLGDAASISGTTNYVAKFTSGTAIGNSQIFDNGTNVGIGTTSPSYKLHVNTTSTVEDMIGMTNGTQTLTLGVNNSAGGSFLFENGNNALRFGTNGSERMRITNAGNVGIGTTTPGAKLEVNGSFRATTKSFIIDHPTKENKKLQYGVLEGPEHSVYVRGKLTNTNVIQLPDYWHALVHEDSITVNLTAIGKKQDLWVEEITDTYITVASETGEINCFYAVFAERKDVEKLVTEFDKE